VKLPKIKPISVHPMPKPRMDDVEHKIIKVTLDQKRKVLYITEISAVLFFSLLTCIFEIISITGISSFCSSQNLNQIIYNACNLN